MDDYGDDFSGDGMSTTSNWLNGDNLIARITGATPQESYPMSTTQEWQDYVAGDDLLSNLPESAGDTGFMDGAEKYLSQAANLLGTTPANLLLSLGGAGLSAYSASKQNQQQADAAKKQQQALFARQMASSVYASPLHLVSPRQAIQPVTTKAPGSKYASEASFFSNNKLPAYFADGGSSNDQFQFQPRKGEDDWTGFLGYLATRKLPSERRYAKESAEFAENMKKTKRIESDEDNSVEARRDKAMNRQQQLDAQERKAMGYANGGSPRYVRGGDSGQADTIDARLSPGEYVFDADTVASMGDGNNEAGAKRLDEMRQNIRAHKRAAPVGKIPPKAKSPLQYLKGAK